MSYTYTFENNELAIWNSESPEKQANILQQKWPNGTPWESQAQAFAWAEIMIDFLQNPNATHRPGNSPEEPKLINYPQEPEPLGSHYLDKEQNIWVPIPGHDTGA